MKLIGIGDIHGRDTWKQIVEQETGAEKEVFIGDYWDSFDIPHDEQLENFRAILRYKEENADRVVLIMGNHDFHYLSAMGQAYSGFQQQHFVEIEDLVKPAIEHGTIQAAYAADGWLFTHAGVTRNWCDIHGIQPVPNQINDLLFKKPSAFKFNDVDSSGYGEHPAQSPIWVRPDSLKISLATQKQVVGHTSNKGIVIGEDVIFMDALGVGQYLIINDGKPEIGYAER